MRLWCSIRLLFLNTLLELKSTHSSSWGVGRTYSFYCTCHPMGAVILYYLFPFQIIAVFCTMKQMPIHNSTDIIADIKQIIEQTRKQAYTSINTLMIQSNWLVGRRIVEEEQGGASQAEYGKALLKNLAT